ncbi:MAG TPA: STAS domain-containing protein [Alphaproteobacteria bacterium]|nr:STAS domain-containing protein [Alphaproteobacteria bacterium]
MNIDLTESGGGLVLALRDKRLDAAAAPAFRERVAAAAEGGHRLLVLDLQHVEFVDSSGLGAIVSALKRLGPGRDLAIAGARPAVRKLFQLTRMDRVFALHDDVAAALAGGAG